MTIHLKWIGFLAAVIGAASLWGAAGAAIVGGSLFFLNDKE